MYPETLLFVQTILYHIKYLKNFTTISKITQYSCFEIFNIQIFKQGSNCISVTIDTDIVKR
jgi:hypothetical protein